MSLRITPVDDVDALEKALRPYWVDYDRAEGNDVTKTPWGFVLEDADGTVVGGATGFTKWGWSYLGNLMVVPEYRGRDGATLLMKQVEDHARANGALGVHLKTFTAEDFYRKMGYVEYGRLDDMPPGKSMVLFCKRV